jgi:hypothetical protein
MHFEHLIEINNPQQPIFPLSRDQLWHGLLLRALDPMVFQPTLSEAAVTRRDANTLTRKLAFGTLTVEDTVHLIPGDGLRYDTAASDEHPGGMLEHWIEEPEPGRLFVRFRYDTQQPEYDTDGLHVGAYLRLAYQAADLDTIRKIRELAEAGTLDAPASWHPS